MNEVVEMNVSTPAQFIMALRMAQNIFAERSVINVFNHTESFARANDLIADIKLGVSALYKNTAGSFATAQLSQYSTQMLSDPFGRFSKITMNTKYFSSPKELNDLICVCAEIAKLLKKKVKNQRNTFEKVRVFNEWIKKNFEYKKTYQLSDHTAIELLKKRSGVCQAIAAIAVLVLSYMGVKILYISGAGKGNSGWGPHAWNVVKINGQWIHVDFTFSMNSSRLTCTKTGIEERLFCMTHQWDRNGFGEQVLDNKWKNIYMGLGEKITIEVTGNVCRVNGVEVLFRKPLLKRNQKRVFVDIASIVRLLGGGIELIIKTGAINICVCNKRQVVKDSLKYFSNGYFDKCILDNIWKNEWLNKSRLKITV